MVSRRVHAGRPRRVPDASYHGHDDGQWVNRIGWRKNSSRYRFTLGLLQRVLRYKSGDTPRLIHVGANRAKLPIRPAFAGPPSGSDVTRSDPLEVADQAVKPVGDQMKSARPVSRSGRLQLGACSGPVRCGPRLRSLCPALRVVSRTSIPCCRQGTWRSGHFELESAGRRLPSAHAWRRIGPRYTSSDRSRCSDRAGLRMRILDGHISLAERQGEHRAWFLTPVRHTSMPQGRSPDKNIALGHRDPGGQAILPINRISPKRVELLMRRGKDVYGTVDKVSVDDGDVADDVLLGVHAVHVIVLGSAAREVQVQGGPDVVGQICTHVPNRIGDAVALDRLVDESRCLAGRAVEVAADRAAPVELGRSLVGIEDLPLEVRLGGLLRQRPGRRRTRSRPEPDRTAGAVSTTRSCPLR